MVVISMFVYNMLAIANKLYCTMPLPIVLATMIEWSVSVPYLKLLLREDLQLQLCTKTSLKLRYY